MTISPFHHQPIPVHIPIPIPMPVLVPLPNHFATRRSIRVAFLGWEPWWGPTFHSTHIPEINIHTHGHGWQGSSLQRAARCGPHRRRTRAVQQHVVAHANASIRIPTHDEGGLPRPQLVDQCKSGLALQALNQFHDCDLCVTHTHTHTSRHEPRLISSPVYPCALRKEYTPSTFLSKAFML